MMAEDCRVIVRGYPCCRAFKGEVPRALLCPIWAYTLSELAPRLHQYRIHDGAEQAPHGEEHPHDDGSFHEVHPRGGDEGSDCQDCHKSVL